MSYRTLFLLLLLAIISPPLQADDITPEHGKYTQSYQSDWSQLPTGDILTHNDVNQIPFIPIVGENHKANYTFTDLPTVHLSNLHFQVSWNQASSKYQTTLMHFENVDEVILDNISIMNMDSDYRAYHSILIEGADRVIIRNLYLAGTVHSYHLRVEGCAEVLIENVEIAGKQYSGSSFHRLGGGIWIKNGNTGGGGIDNTGMSIDHPRLPGWQVIQNCYIHDNTEDDGAGRNQDGILFHAPGHGIVFNNTVENWLRPNADAAMDLGYRRVEPEYQSRILRVERNIVRNATYFKTPGTAPGPNLLYLVNNLMINTQIADYHGGGNDVHYLHNTFIYDPTKSPTHLTFRVTPITKTIARLWDFYGPTYMENNLFYRLDHGFDIIYISASLSQDKYLHFVPNHNVYAVPAVSTDFLTNSSYVPVISTLNDWQQETSYDMQSVVVSPSTVPFADYVNDNYQLTSNPWPTVTDTQTISFNGVLLQVTQDFNGNPSNQTPGAFTAP